MYNSLKFIAEQELDIVSKYIETNDKSLVPKILKHIAADEQLSKN